MRFEELNWFDIEAYLKKDTRLMLVIGSCEQHGYLSLATDVKIPLAVADSASKQSGVLVAPPVNFGCSPYFLDYPGTLSLRVTTLMDLVEDLISSAYRTGFHQILVLNGHGGNEPLRGRLYEVINALPDLQLRWYAWWQSHSVQQLLEKYELKSYHGGWVEAFPFTRVVEVPPEKKTPPNIPGLLGAEQARQIYGDGVFGGTYHVDETIMQKLFETCLKDVLRLLQFDE
jgi:creatinine amidohydrolase